MEKREKIIQILVTEKEYKFLKENADLQSLALASFIRSSIINSTKKLKMEEQPIKI